MQHIRLPPAQRDDQLVRSGRCSDAHTHIACLCRMAYYRDLYLLFRKHGTILSVHTMISKGYGFVSFAQKEHATAAIQQMNGFRVGERSCTYHEYLISDNRVCCSSARSG
jgi:hypothetical protein